MRTTVDIDDDILQAARELASRERVSLGKALSNLARRALTHPLSQEVRNGIPLFPRRADPTVVTLELVNRLRDELE